MRRSKSQVGKSPQDRDLPKYSIAVAADLSGLPQQQLRRLEESGLITPTRTTGNTRRYSDADLDRVTEVSELAEEGINAAGIRHIFALRQDLHNLRDENANLRRQVAEHQAPPVPAETTPASESGSGAVHRPPARGRRARPRRTSAKSRQQ